MNSSRMSPSYRGCRPVSAAAVKAAKASSIKRDTEPELALRRALFARGLRYRIDDDALPGRPDVVFRRARVVVFCDGDFWHGRNLEQRLAKLRRGHNSRYWVAKIRSNKARDDRTSTDLTAAGWLVLRFWESDVRANANKLAGTVHRAVRRRQLT